MPFLHGFNLTFVNKKGIQVDIAMLGAPCIPLYLYLRVIRKFKFQTALLPSVPIKRSLQSPIR